MLAAANIEAMADGYKTPERAPFNSPVLPPPIVRHRFNPEEEFYDLDLGKEEGVCTPLGYEPNERRPISRVLDFATEDLRKSIEGDEPFPSLEPLPNHSHFEQIDPSFLFKYMSARTKEEQAEVVSKTAGMYELLIETKRFLRDFDTDDADDLIMLHHIIEKLEEAALIWTTEYTMCVQVRDAL